MRENRVHIGQKPEDLGFNHKVVPKAPKFKNQGTTEPIKLPEIVQQELMKLGFDYDKLKNKGTELNKHLTLLYDQIDLPYSSGQQHKERIHLMVGVKYPQDSKKAAVDFLYATYTSIRIKSGQERELLAVTFNSKDGNIPAKKQIPEKMERLVREAEIGRKFNLGKNGVATYNQEATTANRLKR